MIQKKKSKHDDSARLHQLVLSLKIEKGVVVPTEEMKRQSPEIHDELRLTLDTNDYGAKITIPLISLADVPWYLIPDHIGSYVSDTLTSYPPFREWCESFCADIRR